jgi:hypothetical protein
MQSILKEKYYGMEKGKIRWSDRMKKKEKLPKNEL